MGLRALLTLGGVARIPERGGPVLPSLPCASFFTLCAHVKQQQSDYGADKLPVWRCAMGGFSD